MAVTYTAAVSLSVILLILSVSHADPLNSKQLKEACDKTPHPEYCLDLIKARNHEPLTYAIFTPRDMAQYLMAIAAAGGHELAGLAHAEQDRLPKGSARRRCMEKLAARFDVAASKLDGVDGELLDDSCDKFYLVYRYVQSNAGVLAQNGNACPDATSHMVSTQKHFAMLMDIILALGKLPDTRCMAPTRSPSVPPRWL